MSQCNQVPTREEEEGGGVGQTINTLVPPPPPLRHPTKRNAHTHARTRAEAAHAMPSRAHTTHIQTCSQARPILPLPPLNPPLFHTCYYAEPSCSTGTVHRGIKSCSVPRMYSTRTQSVCVCVHTRGRTDRAPPVPPPSEVAGGPLPNGVIQRSR